MTTPSNPRYQFTSEEYREKINSPATSPEYFRNFILPLLERALKKGGPVRFVDLACGHAMAMEFVAGLPEADRIEVTGLDLSGDALNEAREYFAAKHPGLKINFIQADAENDLPMEPGAADAGTAINAMAYKQGHMLKTLFNALKPGASCVINFFIPAKNQAYIDYYKAMGCEVYERKLEVSSHGRSKTYTLLVTDFSGFKDPKISMLGAQSFFRKSEDIEDLARFLGFEIESRQPFEFYSEPIKAMVANDVYTFKKPETSPEIELGRLEVSEKVEKVL